MTNGWHILIVDDEADVHRVSQLALRRNTWRGRTFTLTSAMSAAEARKILDDPASPQFQVALVDVVMESNQAGLELCDYIREHASPSLRIVLRTGQPGLSPEESVMERYDIDQYLAKADLSQERLFAAVRTGCRMSLDIATSLALENQMRQLTAALQLPSAGARELLAVQSKALDFLEMKHDGAIAFVSNIADSSASDSLAAGERGRGVVDHAKVQQALRAVHGKGSGELVAGEQCGLEQGTFVMPLHGLAKFQSATSAPAFGQKLLALIGVAAPQAAAPPPVEAGYYVALGRTLSAKEQKDLSRDLDLFATNWRLAYSILHLREATVRERVLALDAKRIAGLNA